MRWWKMLQSEFYAQLSTPKMFLFMARIQNPNRSDFYFTKSQRESIWTPCWATPDDLDAMLGDPEMKALAEDELRVGRGAAAGAGARAAAPPPAQGHRRREERHRRDPGRHRWRRGRPLRRRPACRCTSAMPSSAAGGSR